MPSTDDPHRHANARATLPRARGFDNTLSLLAEGYGFMTRRHAALGSDAFFTRLLLRRALCVRGEDAARMFWQPGRFTRRRALPPTTLKLLQDVGSVATLDGDMHRQRKAMFMGLFGPLERQRLVALAEAQWRARFTHWPDRMSVNVHREAEEVLCRAVCEWIGIPPLADAEASRRTRELAAMIAAAGSAGPRAWRALLVRNRTEHWARALVDAVRAGRIRPPAHSPLCVIAGHRDADGMLLNRRHAAVELLNLLRPTVAVARYIAFAVLALHAHPQARARIAAGDDAYTAMFTQEVRRYYPFFPAVAGRALHDFDWRGMRIDKGTWVLMDIHGTNHDPALWGDPQVFRPERFERREGSGFDLVAQGGGDHYAGHRCPGESATVDLVASTLKLFAGEIAYEVPPQDLSVSLRRMPTLPASGMVIERVRVRQGSAPSVAFRGR
ncbi:cytochrome P450 [uncultured Massilia sp.]|uniref:cytochrome P450 n=1 Tax=uncultured Massilia sp. TaxID=169973 RepID=UPI0025D3156F|nr:cytochrome P450 [uncultured Massilia sp.]